MRYVVKIETKKDFLYLYVINNNVPALCCKWEDATFFRTIAEATHGISLIRQNFADLGIQSFEVRGVNTSMDSSVYAKELA